MSKSNSSVEAADTLAAITTYQSGVAQATAFRIVKKHTAHALKEYHLTCMQWFTIGTVRDAGDDGMRITDLAKALDTTLAYMTTTVNLLESRGILVKKTHATDARTRLIAVAPSYRRECVVIETHVREQLRELLYKNITSAELMSYIQVLYKISTLRG